MSVNEVRAALAQNMTEASLQNLVIGEATRLGWLVHHDRPAMDKKGRWATHIMGDKGFPDLVLAREGTVLFVELKAPKGKLTDEQEVWGFHLDFTIWRPIHWYDGTIKRVLS